MKESIEPLEEGNLHGNIETTTLLPMWYDIIPSVTDVSFGKMVNYTARYIV